jgi:hypothetical protein
MICEGVHRDHQRRQTSPRMQVTHCKHQRAPVDEADALLVLENGKEDVGLGGE